ncbi:site-2 protease family protein [Amycolatopsis granulosa]|uniref:site-2 protease family protein n=1 Tax=Amycolatopsis granulosa TaxID=185684 RepID=UPI001420B0B6|nr:site-2 protease family protein [Amycolatopsis granulosa]NIH87447.1 Zn-dependent protease [Amycolatopsis granulosa]
MVSTVWLGRFEGIRVGLHWSVFGMAGLLVVGLPITQWPPLAPGQGIFAAIIASVITAVLFVLSLCAHELPHALVARRSGIEVREVTLWLLGGVTRLRGAPRSPGVEFRVAFAGPLVSLLLAAIFGFATWMTSPIGNSLSGAVLGYLAVLNVILGGFNLIPVAPLDGGRVLRSILWAAWHDRHRATIGSARAARFLGFAVCALGVLTLLRGPIGLGVWPLLVGLFVVNLALAEERDAELGTSVAAMRVRDVMTMRPATAPAATTVATFLRDNAMLRQHSAYPLVDPVGRFAGLVTLTRLRAVPPAQRPSTLLGEIACAPTEIPRATPDEPLLALLPRMSGCADGRALVFDADRLVGIVSPSDISRAVTLRGLGVDWHGGADVAVVRSRVAPPLGRPATQRWP